MHQICAHRQQPTHKGRIFDEAQEEALEAHRQVAGREWADVGAEDETVVRIARSDRPDVIAVEALLGVE